MNNNTGQTVLALLTGAAIGAGLGILYAPEKGSKTRDDISKGAKKAQKELTKQLKEVSRTIGMKVNSAKESFENQLDNTLASASYEAEDVIKTLEAKLKTLREQNAKLQKK